MTVSAITAGSTTAAAVGVRRARCPTPAPGSRRRQVRWPSQEHHSGPRRVRRRTARHGRPAPHGSGQAARDADRAGPCLYRPQGTPSHGQAARDADCAGHAYTGPRGPVDT